MSGARRDPNPAWASASIVGADPDPRTHGSSTMHVSSTFLTVVLTAIAAPIACAQNGEPAPAAPVVTSTESPDSPAAKQEEAAEQGEAAETDLPVVRLTLPNEETIVEAAKLENPPSAKEVDAMLARMLAKIGYKNFSELKTIGFMRGSTHWRSGKQLTYDSWKTLAYTSLPLRARAEFASNYDENDRLVPFAAVVNDDDRFELLKREVLATEGHEKDAVAQISHELTTALAPFYLASAGAKATYVGRSTLKSHTPKKFDDITGCSEYEAVTREFDVLELSVPEPYSQVLGPTVRYYLEADGALRMVQANNKHRPEFYGAKMPLFFEIVETTEMGGMVLPTRIDVSLEFDSGRTETIALWDWTLDPQIPVKLLRRP